MSIEFTGGATTIERKITGLYSLDRAFIGIENEIGVPLGSAYEIFGVSSTGKSTFCYGFAGLLAPPVGIVLCDFEGYVLKHIESVLSAIGFSGRFHILQEKEDEDQLNETISFLYKDEFSTGIVDSLGAISPIAEQEGDIGEANMGRRAFIVAQFNRKALKLFRYHPQKVILEINHYYPRIGTRGYMSPAGEVKKYLAAIRIKLKRNKEYPDGSYILEGEVVKNRHGYIGRKFYVFMLAGKGIHIGLTAMWDAIQLGLVEYKKTIKIGDTQFGYMKDIVMKAHAGEDEFFQPFVEILKGADNGSRDIEIGDNDEERSGNTEVEDNSTEGD
jgi:RecA/RadA recombinase